MAWQMLMRSWVRDQLLRQVSASAICGDGVRQSGHADEPLQAAFLFALREESGGLVDRMKDVVTTRANGFTLHRGRLVGRTIAVAETGIGRASALQATEAIISGHCPALVVSTGFAAGLDVSIQRGDLIIASDVVLESGESLSLDSQLDTAPTEAALRMHIGPLLTVDRLVNDPAEKRRLGEATGAIGLDMETFAVAEDCRRSGTPLIAIRIVSDAVGDRLPPEVGRLVRQRTLAGKLGALTGAVLSRPSSVKDFYQLKEDALVASDRLAEVLQAIASEFPLAAGDEPEPAK